MISSPSSSSHVAWYILPVVTVITHTTLMLTISPVAFLTFLRPRMKYQYRDLATTSLGAKIRMRYRDGVGLVSVGRCLPMTWYSWRRPDRSYVSKPVQPSRVKSVENVKSGSESRVRELARGGVVFE